MLDNIGSVEERLGRYQPAADHRRALALFRLAGDLTGQAQALTNLGDVETRIARYEEAADHHQHALALYRQAGAQALAVYTELGAPETEQVRARLAALDAGA